MYYNYTPVPIFCQGQTVPKRTQYAGNPEKKRIKPPDNKYPLLSYAIAGGLYHPNCKDIHTTYFEGISSPPKPLTDEEKRRAEENYKLEQQQRYNERQIRKYKRLSEYTLDPQERQKYAARLEQWQQANAKLVEEHGDVLRRRYEREVARDLRVKVPAPPEISDRLREFSTQEGMLKVLRVSAEKDESAQLERYRAVLGTLAPDSIDKFLDIKYNKPKKWNLLKYQYRTVNRKV